MPTESGSAPTIPFTIYGDRNSTQIIAIEGPELAARVAAVTKRTVATWNGTADNARNLDWFKLSSRKLIAWGVTAADSDVLAINASRNGITEIKTISSEFPADLTDKSNADKWLAAKLEVWKPATRTVEAVTDPEAQASAEIEAQQPAGNTVLAPDPDDGLTPVVSLKRDHPLGAEGVLNMPKFYPEQPFNSEVHLAKVFLKELRDRCEGNLVYAETKLWSYGPTAWTAVDEGHLHRAIQRLDTTLCGEKLKPLALSSSMAKGIKKEAMSYCENQSFFESFTEGMNCRNGLVILDDNGNPKLAESDREHRVRFTLDADYIGARGKLPEDSLLHKLLNGCFLGDKDAADKINLIAEALGAAAFGMATKLKEPKAFIFLGETARNGKSTIADLFRAIFPASAVARVTPGVMHEEKHVIKLLGAAVNVADELSGAAVAGEDFKSAVTGQPVDGRKLYQNVQTFAPRALHVFTTNVLPTFKGTFDPGLRRRLIVVRFNRPIPDNEIITDIIKQIREKEMDLLISFAIYGAQRLKRQGKYTVCRESVDALEGWITEAAKLTDYFEEKCVIGDDFYVERRELYSSVRQWRKDCGDYSTIKDAEITQMLRGIIPDLRVIQPRAAGQKRCFAGFKLRGSLAASSTIPF